MSLPLKYLMMCGYRYLVFIYANVVGIKEKSQKPGHISGIFESKKSQIFFIFLVFIIITFHWDQLLVKNKKALNLSYIHQI